MTAEERRAARRWFQEDFCPSYGVALAVHREILHKRTRFQDVLLFENEQWGKVLVLDGAVQLTERDEFLYHEALVWPALLYHPEPRHVLIVGGGDGGALEEVLKFPTVEAVMQVEIDADVVEIAKEHLRSVHRGAYRDPRLRLEIADASEFLPHDTHKYDVILMDMSDPIGPSQALYDTIYLAQARKHLRAGGILGMQSGSALVRREIFKKVCKTVGGVFPISRPYAAPVPAYPGGLWTFMLASRNRRALSAGEAARAVQRLRKLPPPRFVSPGFLRDIASPPAYLLPTGSKA